MTTTAQEGRAGGQPHPRGNGEHGLDECERSSKWAELELREGFHAGYVDDDGYGDDYSKHYSDRCEDSFDEDDRRSFCSSKKYCGPPLEWRAASSAASVMSDMSSRTPLPVRQPPMSPREAMSLAMREGLPLPQSDRGSSGYVGVTFR